VRWIYSFFVLNWSVTLFSVRWFSSVVLGLSVYRAFVQGLLHGFHILWAFIRSARIPFCVIFTSFDPFALMYCSRCPALIGFEINLLYVRSCSVNGDGINSRFASFLIILIKYLIDCFPSRCLSLNASSCIPQIKLVCVPLIFHFGFLLCFL